MLINWYRLFAIIAMALVGLIYAIKFYGSGTSTVEEFAIWGQFGDYMGGSLNPILSFISIMLLIKSLNLQNETNEDLRKELNENKRSEKLRSLGVLFFNMINSQKLLLDNFTFSFIEGETPEKRGAAAIIHIEDGVQLLRQVGAKDSAIANFLLALDSTDQIYGILRAFYITVKMVTEKLSDENGFTSGDRRDHLLTLINFTDYAQFRLVLMSIQFLDFHGSKYLKENKDFMAALEEVKSGIDLY